MVMMREMTAMTTKRAEQVSVSMRTVMSVVSTVTPMEEPGLQVARGLMGMTDQDEEKVEEEGGSR